MISISLCLFDDIVIDAIQIIIMFVSLESIRFPIPFKQITSGEQQLIERIDSCRRNGRQLIGEAKLSDRQTTIILSYLITALIRHNPSHNSSQPSQEVRRDEQSLKTVVYLCRGEGRKNQLVKIAENVHRFVLKALSTEQPNTFSLEQEPLIESNVVLKFYQGNPEDEKEHEEIFQSCKEKGLIFKRIYFLRIQKFLQFKLRRKEDIAWKKQFEFGCEADFNAEQLNYLNKKVDYLLIETNDLEGIMTDLLTVDIYEIHLHRAFLEFRKLNRYYNFRLEERRGKASSKHGSKKDLDFSRDGNGDSKKEVKHQQQLKKEQQLKQQTRNQQQKQDQKQYQKDEEQQSFDLILQNITEMQEEIEKKMWNVADYDKKFNDLYKQKREFLMTARVGYVPNTLVSPEYEECYFLMNLQIVGYILSFLLLEWRQNQFQEKHEILNNFLNYVYEKTLVPTSYMRKLRRIFLTFIRKHPPILLGEELSYVYIDQVLYFFQKAVIWNEVFCKASNVSNLQANPEQNAHGADINLVNRFIVFREKTNKDSNLKLVSLDQKILIDLLAESSKNFSILQNLALSFDYYDNVFRPEKIKDIVLEYRCPKVVGQCYKHTVNGLIVSSTPNEQDLHLSNDRQESSSLDLLEDKKVDKDHYSQIIRAYGVLVHDICELMPDGLIVYFPTRSLLKQCRTEWQSKENIYEKINQIKRIFEEEQWQRDNVFNVHSFKKRCQIGRGAVYFISAESEFAKSQTFFSYYSKCIIFLGVPSHPYPLQTQQKVKFLKLKQHHIFQQALKNVCRCLSNCINSSQQIKTVVFADIAYNRTDLQKKWFPFIREGNLNTLQVLEWIICINKSQTLFMEKQREEEKKRKKEETERKREDRLDLIRRASNTHVMQ